jgi:hypothetical protein
MKEIVFSAYGRVHPFLFFIVLHFNIRRQKIHGRNENKDGIGNINRDKAYKNRNQIQSHAHPDFITQLPFQSR